MLVRHSRSESPIDVPDIGGVPGALAGHIEIDEAQVLYDLTATKYKIILG